MNIQFNWGGLLFGVASFTVMALLFLAFIFRDAIFESKKKKESTTEESEKTDTIHTPEPKS